jgi:N-acetylmuramoyl-L-alanine amidase
MSTAKAADPLRREEPPPSPPESAPAASAGGGATAGEREVGPRLLTIVLDPGHGGHDTGAIGPTGLMEKDVVLDLALRLRRLLTDRLGVRVLMTRAEDVFIALPERASLANRAKADFFISLHVNGAGQRGAVGFETFFFSREPSDNDARASTQRENLILDGNGSMGGAQESLLKMTLADMAVTRDMRESSDLAERLLAALDKILRVENRGVKSGPFYVLATAAMPAVLVESAFITNPREERRLQRENYRQQIAEALCDGVAAYKARYEQRLGLARPVPAGARS